MIPDTITTDSSIIAVSPSLTYKIDLTSGRIMGTVDEKEAVAQSIKKVLSTDRYSCLIYNWYYGNEIYKIVGKPLEYAMIELKRLIRDALLQDDRVTEVSNFSFTSVAPDAVFISFTVVTIYGRLDASKEVSI